MKTYERENLRKKQDAARPGLVCAILAMGVAFLISSFFIAFQTRKAGSSEMAVDRLEPIMEQPMPQAEKPVAEMETNAGILIHDKGASFTFASSSRSNPPPVPPVNPHLRKSETATR